MSFLLESTEIERITGYTRKADQRRWLQSHGWKFEVSAIGWPVVSRQHAELMLSGIGAAANGAPVPDRSIFSKRAA